MAEQVPPGQPADQISADGRWRWDGQRWVPNALAPQAAGYMAPSGQPGMMVVAAKNPAVSLLISFFLPGVGSMVNGDTNTGILILVLYVVSVALSFFLIGLPFALGLWI
jgi:hypothetical protein